jgi:lipoprotein-releasing system permease protein
MVRTLLGVNGALQIQDQMQDTIRSMEAGGGGSGSSFQVAEQEARKYVEGIPQPRLVMDALTHFANVETAAEVLRGDVVIHRGFRDMSAQIYGIDINNFSKVSAIASQIVRGELETYRDDPDSVLIGSVLADRLELEVGNSFIIEVPATGESRRYRVGAIYETGATDIDKVRVYIHLSEARSLLKKTTEASYIQVNLWDKNRAPEDAVQMERTLHYSAVDWQYREREWLQVLGALQLLSAIVVMVFIVIAGLAMFNTLAMMVLEKTKEIAILRSMGYERRDISLIFIWQAVIVLAVGAVAGWALGAAATYIISKVHLELHTIIRTSSFVVVWSPWHYLEATVLAVVVVMIASLAPARRAARLEPGDVIRGTAQ